MARKATTAKKDATRLPAKSPAKAMVPAKTRSKSAVAKPAAKKAVSKAAPKKRIKPDLEQDVFARLHRRRGDELGTAKLLQLAADRRRNVGSRIVGRRTD